MSKIRPIVRDAFRIDELLYQIEINVEDNLLATGDMAEVNEKCDDAYLIGEARHRLDLINDQIDCADHDPVEISYLNKDRKQLTRFIKKWKK
jgi:hypothetical protein